MRFKILGLMAVLMLAGCSTPRQQYQTDASLYNGASIGLTLARKDGKISDTTWTTKIAPIMAQAKTHLAEALVWLNENPTLADVPGYKLPSLDPVGVAIGILLNYAGEFDLVPIDTQSVKP